MTQKELKRLSRGDLLEMMLSLSKENEHLRKDLHTARQQLEDRRLTVEQSGTLADAVMQLNGVFQAAQAACEQYSLNIRAQAAEVLAPAQEKLDTSDSRAAAIVTQAGPQADRILAEARKQAADLLAEARAQAAQILAEAERSRSRQEEKYGWITELMENSEEA